MALSKTDYMHFLRHPAWLWLKNYEKHKLPPIDANIQAWFLSLTGWDHTKITLSNTHFTLSGSLENRQNIKNTYTRKIPILCQDYLSSSKKTLEVQAPFLPGTWGTKKGVIKLWQLYTPNTKSF